MRRVHLLVPIVCAALGASVPAGAQDPSGLSALDVVRIQGVTDVEVAPDGRHLLFLRTRPRLADDPPGRDYRELWLLPLGETKAERPEREEVLRKLRKLRVGRTEFLEVWPAVWPIKRSLESLGGLKVRFLGLPRQAMQMEYIGRPEDDLILYEDEAPHRRDWSRGPWSVGTGVDLLDNLLKELRAALRDPSITWRPGPRAGVIEIGSAASLASAPSGQPTPRPLITGKVRVGAAHFTPDGHFVTVVRKGDGEHPEVHLLPVTGGDPMPLTTTAHGVSSHRISPDGRHIAFTSRAPKTERAERASELGFSAEIVEEAPRSTHLWVWDRASGESRRLSGEGTVHDFVWSPDSKSIAYASTTVPWIDHFYMFQTLHWVDVASGEGGTFDKQNPSKLGPFAWSPDGETLAYVAGLDRRDPHAGTLHLAPRSGEKRVLTPDFGGMVHDVHWKDDDDLLCVVSLGVKTWLAEIGTDGSLELVPGGGDVACREVSLTAGGKVFGAGSRGDMPPEVVELTTEGARRLTWSNPWLAERRLGRQRIVRFTARDGLTIEGLLIEALGAAEGPRPLVIVAHGGPEAHYSDGWNTRYAEPGQALAAKGFHVWYPNYRASTGYGVAFAKLDHGDPMGGQFEDHLDAIDHFEEKGLVDAERVGIIGGSYGGYTAAWAATKGTEHFAAAVSFVPFTDMVSKWWSADIPWEFFLVHYRETWPDGQKKLLEERSPLTHAADCRTPLLLCGGTADSRVHPAQPHMLWRKVKILTETPVRYVRYPGEGHGNATNVHRYDYCVRGMRWLEHYLVPGARGKTPPEPHLDLAAWKATGDWTSSKVADLHEPHSGRACCEYQ